MIEDEKLLLKNFRIRSKNAARLLANTGTGYKTWFSLYRDRINEKKRIFKYMDNITGKVFDVEGICKSDVTYVFNLSQMTLYNWISRGYFIEPSITNLKGFQFFLINELENVAKFMSINQYRRFSDNMPKDELDTLHNCFLLPRQKFRELVCGVD